MRALAGRAYMHVLRCSWSAPAPRAQLVAMHAQLQRNQWA
jgi:hypothetical protein